jgi:hypothetical protein
MADRSIFQVGEPDVEFFSTAGLRIRPADAEAVERAFLMRATPRRFRHKTELAGG